MEPGSALASALEKASKRFREMYASSIKALDEVLDRLDKLLVSITHHNNNPAAYGVDGSMARLEAGSLSLTLLHAVGVRVEEGGVDTVNDVAAAVILPPGSVDALEALEAGMVLLETLVVEALPRHGVVFLDGPIADPPWRPRETFTLRSVASQLSKDLAIDPSLLAGIHEYRARVFSAHNVIGVVKRLTGERMLSNILGLESKLPNDGVLASMILARLLHEKATPVMTRPVRLGKGVYSVYGGIYSCYVFDTQRRTFYRIEVLEGHDCIKAASKSLTLTLPGQKYPLPVLAAHEKAQVPRGVIEALALKLKSHAAAIDPAAAIHAFR